jgi:hypothetical protein
MTKAEDITRLLNDLGSSMDEVADRLRAEKVKGFPGSPNFCPIANYLEKHGHQVSVGTPFVYIGDDKQIKMPSPCAAFAKQFDDNHYGDLKTSSISKRFE